LKTLMVVAGEPGQRTSDLCGADVVCDVFVTKVLLTSWSWRPTLIAYTDVISSLWFRLSLVFTWHLYSTCRQLRTASAHAA